MSAHRIPSPVDGSSPLSSRKRTKYRALAVIRTSIADTMCQCSLLHVDGVLSRGNAILSAMHTQRRCQLSDNGATLSAPPVSCASGSFFPRCATEEGRERRGTGRWRGELSRGICIVQRYADVICVRRESRSQINIGNSARELFLQQVRLDSNLYAASHPRCRPLPPPPLSPPSTTHPISISFYSRIGLFSTA